MQHFLPNMVHLVFERAQSFKEKFGREMGPDVPIFFDPDADEPRPLNSEQSETVITEAMRKAGIDEEFIYAYHKTGFIVGRNTPLIPEEEAEWNAAILEYRKNHKGSDVS